MKVRILRGQLELRRYPPLDANSRRKAYAIADAVLGYISLFVGYECDPMHDSRALYEVRHQPRPDRSEDQLKNDFLLPFTGEQSAVWALETGAGVSYS